MTTTQDGGKVVSLTHRPPLPPGNTPGTHFCYRLTFSAVKASNLQQKYVSNLHFLNNKIYYLVISTSVINFVESKLIRFVEHVERRGKSRKN